MKDSQDVETGNDAMMTKVEKVSQETAPVLYRTTIHWAALFGPAMLFIIGGVSVRTRFITSIILIALAILWGIFSIYNLRISELTLTATKLTVKIGFPFKRFYEFPFDRIAAVDFQQPALGMLLNFGKIIIMQTNGKGVAFRLVANPMDFVTKLKQELSRFREENSKGSTEG